MLIIQELLQRKQQNEEEEEENIYSEELKRKPGKKKIQSRRGSCWKAEIGPTHLRKL